MSEPEFAHLHVHTQYSMLDGAVKVKDLVKRVAAAKMKSVAVTDHGNMFGAVTFYKAAKEAGVQSILGCEIEVVDPSEGVTPAPRAQERAVLGVLLDRVREAVGQIDVVRRRVDRDARRRVRGPLRALVEQREALIGALGRA